MPCHAACQGPLPALFSPAQGSMQLFMWQADIVGSHISSWTVLTFLGQRLMIMMKVTRTQTHLHQPWRLDRFHSVPLS